MTRVSLVAGFAAMVAAVSVASLGGSSCGSGGTGGGTAGGSAGGSAGSGGSGGGPAGSGTCDTINVSNGWTVFPDTDGGVNPIVGTASGSVKSCTAGGKTRVILNV